MDLTAYSNYKEKQQDTKKDFDIPLKTDTHAEIDKHIIGEAIAPPTTVTALGATAAVGNSPYPARSDHVHSGGSIASVGQVIMWAGSVLPANTILCNGAAYSRTTYADLFAEIGTTYGSGDGSTTFNVPDFGSRMPRGNTRTASGGNNNSSIPYHRHGAAGNHDHGLNDHVHSGPNHRHSVDPPPTDTDSDSHSHWSGTKSSTTSAGTGAFSKANTSSGTNINTDSDTHNHSVNIGAFWSEYNGTQNTGPNSGNTTSDSAGNTTYEGSSTTNANVPAYVGLQFLIGY